MQTQVFLIILVGILGLRIKCVGVEGLKYMLILLSNPVFFRLQARPIGITLIDITSVTAQIPPRLPGNLLERFALKVHIDFILVVLEVDL